MVKHVPTDKYQISQVDRGINITLNGLRGISPRAMGNPRHSSRHTSPLTQHYQARDITLGERRFT